MRSKSILVLSYLFLALSAYAQNVGIGTTTPGTKLTVAGGIASTPVSAAAAASVTIPNNASIFYLTAVAGSRTDALTMTTPTAGQYLTIYNLDGNPATFAGYTITASTGVMTFQYINSTWQAVSDNSFIGGGNYVKNQTAQQASSNFNISGNGVIGGTETVAGLVTQNSGLTETGTAAINTTGTAATSIGNTTGGVSVKSLTTAGIVTNTAAGLLGTTATVPVANGGTGDATLAAGGVLYGNGIGAVQVTGAPTSGQILVGNTTTPSFATMSGDATITNAGVVTVTGSGSGNGYIKNQTAAAQTAGFYINGNGIFNGGKVSIGTATNPAMLSVGGNAIFGASLTSRSTPGLTVSYSNATTYAANTDPTDAARGLSISNEGSTANAMAILSMRSNASGGANNQMLDMKLVNPNNGASTLIYSFGPNDVFTDYFAFTSIGNMGIGTTAPSAKLHIAGGGTQDLIVGNGGTNAQQLLIGNNGTTGGVIQSVLQGIAYDVLSLNPSGGNVGVGQSSPAYKLDVNGSANVNGSLYLYNNNGAATNKLFLSGTDANHYIYSTGTSGNQMYFGEYGGVFHFYNTNTSADMLYINGNTNTINIPYLTASAAVYTDASKNLTSTAPTTGALGYWTRNSGSGYLYNTNTGDKVGIGTTTPAQKLDVAGNITVEGNYLMGTSYNQDMIRQNNDANWTFGGYFDGGSNYWMQSTYYDVGDQYRGFRVQDRNSGGVVFAANKKYSYFQYANVGIGTTTPGYALEVVDAGNANQYSGTFAVYANNLTQGVGIGYQGIQALGSNTNQDLALNSRGTGNVTMEFTGTTGGVAIGNNAPGANLLNVSSSASNGAGVVISAETGVPYGSGGGNVSISGGAANSTVNSGNSGGTISITAGEGYVSGGCGSGGSVNISAGGNFLGTATNCAGVIALGSINFYTYGNSGTTATKAMTIYGPNNFVGIGTSTPNAPLHVSTGNSSGITTPNLGRCYFNSGSGGISCQTSTSGNIMVQADGYYWANGGGYVATSDARIKNIQGKTDNAADLQTISQIEITDYKYKDAAANGDKPQKKVIAQQVNAVYPQAINQMEGIIPNVFDTAKRVSLDGNETRIETARPHDFKTGDIVKLIGENSGEKILPVTVKDANTFSVAIPISGERVFVYGKKVNDLLTVDYDAISMLNVSATQELYKIIKAQQETIHAQQDKIASQDQQIGTIRAENSSVKSDVDRLKASVETLQQILESKANK